ncbi:MAG: hypothetical protein AAF726_08500 [Planctomycetota bacterium]
MRLSTVRFAAPAVLLTAPVFGQGAADKFDFDVVPDFRATTNAEFAGWDVFTIAFGGPNTPDDAGTTAASTITQMTPGAIITSTMNIYHPSATPVFELDTTTATDAREVVLQLRTLGNPLDVNSPFLQFDDGGSTVTLAADVYTDLSGGGGFAAENYFSWDLTGQSAEITSFKVGFAGMASNLSLDAALFDVRVDGAIGTNYCSANANSTGVPAEISARGTELVDSNDITLVATSLPANASAFFLNSLDQGFAANPGGSQGNLCLGGAVGRYDAFVFNSGSAGEGSLTIDLTAIPTPTGLATAMAGDTWNFQTWYRDANPSATSNFSNGVSVTLL